MKPRLARVQWEDITDIQDDKQSQWFTQAEAATRSSNPDSEAESIGWILRLDSRWLVIAGTRLPGDKDSETSYSSIHKIPRGCVRRLRWLR